MKQLVLLILFVFCLSFGRGSDSRREEIEDWQKIVELGAKIDGKYHEWKRGLPKDADDSFQKFYREMHDEEEQQERRNLDSSAQDQLISTENEDVPDEEVDNSAREFQQFLEKKDVHFGAREKRVACSCSGLQCSCCQRVTVHAINFNENCCATVRYLNKDYGVAFTLSIGSKIVYRKEISAKDPPPICYPIPYTGVQACADFYDVGLGRTYLRGCLNLLVKIPIVSDPSIHLGCFSFTRQTKKRVINSSYDRAAMIETGAEAEAIQAEPRYQRLNGENQPLNDEDVVLPDRSQEPPEESWQNDQ